jgi:hypothetical protein
MNRFSGAGPRLALSAAAITAAVGAVGAVGAFGVGAPAANAAITPGNTAVNAIHQASCTKSTFDVFYHAKHGKYREGCFAGAGAIRPNIHNVWLIYTGRNTGVFETQSCHAFATVSFKRDEEFRPVAPCPVTLTFLEINR